jgi:hypothetical protein
MALSFTKLKEQATEIKNEIRVRMNTAVRIGVMFLNIIEKMETCCAGMGTGTGAGTDIDDDAFIISEIPDFSDDFSNDFSIEY